MFRNVRIEWWYMLIPFVLLIMPAVGLLMLIMAIWRAGYGMAGHRDRRAARWDARQKWVKPKWKIVHDQHNPPEKRGW